MILICNDFEFDGRTLKGQNLITVSFDDDTSLPSSIVRQMDTSEMNKYRVKEIGYGMKYTETLVFDIDIMKDFCVSSNQNDLEFSPEEYDDIVTWLSSSQNNTWLNVTTSSNSLQKVKGYFSSITPFDSAGVCYGVKCTFTCDSPFSYVEKSQNQTIDGVSNFLVNNQGSDLYDYVYPVIKIQPNQNGEMFIHNMSDSVILENGAFSVSSDPIQNISNLQSKIQNYAMLNNLTVTYVIDPNTQDLKLIFNNTVLLFYMTDSYGVKNKYVAYFLELDRQYYICQGGFFYCNVNQSLNLEMDCENLSFYDALGRPVLFTNIGIEDEDDIYWPRLIHGNNTFRIGGDVQISISYLEPRKGMLI